MPYSNSHKQKKKNGACSLDEGFSEVVVAGDGAIFWE